MRYSDSGYTEGVIHAGNAAKICAPLIIEAANGPVTAEADQIARKTAHHS